MKAWALCLCRAGVPCACIDYRSGECSFWNYEYQDRGGVQFDLTVIELCHDCAQVQKSKHTTLWKREVMRFRF